MALVELKALDADAVHQAGQETQAVSNNWQAWFEELMTKKELHLVLWFEDKKKGKEPQGAGTGVR